MTGRATCETSSLRTVATALQMLSLFNHLCPQWSVPELARRLQLPYSTAYRYVNALVSAGYLEPQDHAGLYRVGLPVIELAGVALNQLDVRLHGVVHLEHLANITQRNGNLSVLYHADILHVAFAVRSAVPRDYTVIGRRSPATCTAMGKVMLADLPFDEVRALVEATGWRPWTPNSITSFPELKRQLEQVRSQGYAMDLGEHGLDTQCVAAPIRGRVGNAFAAISLSGTRSEMPEAHLHELAPTVIHHAEMISHHLGYVATHPG